MPLIDATVNGTVTANAQTVTLDVRSHAAITVTLTGTWAGTIVFEASPDSVTWVAANAAPVPSGSTVTSTTANGTWLLNVAAMASLRLRSSAWTSGTASVAVRASVASVPVFPTGTIPYTNTSGTLTGDSANFSRDPTTGAITLKDVNGNPTHLPSRKKTGVPKSAASEVQALYAVGTVSGGSYKLANVTLVAGGTGTTASIAWNANGLTIAAAVVAAGGNVVGSTNTAVTPTTATYADLTFAGTLANAPQSLMTVDNTNGGAGGITGGGSVAITRRVAGYAGDFAGAAVGDPVGDSTTGQVYRNTGSAALPVWTPLTPRQPMRSGDIYGFLGDSITVQSENTVAVSHAGWPGFAVSASRGRMQGYRNFGVGGDAVAQITARLPDVIASPITKCVVLAGINDIQVGRTVAAIWPDVQGVYTALLNAGIEPVLCTLTPFTGNTTFQQKIGNLNWLIQDYAVTNGFMCVDFHTRCVDPATGNWLANYSGDGTHPTGLAARRVMGQALADVVMGTVPRAAPWVANNVQDYAAGGISLVSGGLFLTNTGGVGAGFAVLAGTGTASIVAPSGTENAAIGGVGIVGNWQQLVWASGAAYTLFESLTAGWSPGDVLQFTGYATTVLEAAAAKAWVMIQYGGSGGPHLMPLSTSWDMDLTTGRFNARAPIPAGTTTAFVNLSTTTSAAASLKVAQLTVVNRTVLGLAN